MHLVFFFFLNMNLDSALYKSVTVIEEVRISQETSTSLPFSVWGGYIYGTCPALTIPDRDTRSKLSHADFML